MNTRLQVEHPITEEVLEFDIVKNRLILPTDESSYSQTNHPHYAIECNIYAEDTETTSHPLPGGHSIQTPKGLGVRIDTHIYRLRDLYLLRFND